jgi:hypothetical protein
MARPWNTSNPIHSTPFHFILLKPWGLVSMLSPMWGVSMFGDSESPVAGETGFGTTGGFGSPSYMGEMGAPGMTDQGHAMQPPFQTQPIHSFQPEYAAPGMTDQGHAMKPPFQTQAIHQFQPQYASPGFTDQGHAMKPSFQTQPIHQFPTYGAASIQLSSGIYQIPSTGRTFAVSSTGTISGQDRLGSIGTYSPGEGMHATWTKEIQEAVASGTAKYSKGGGKGGKAQNAASFIDAFAKGIGAKFEPSGESAPASVTTQQASGTDWGKIAMWSAIGIGGLAGIYVISKAISASRSA